MIRLPSLFKSPITTVATLFLLCNLSFGQEVEALQSERDRLIKEIKETNILLKENQKKSGNVSHQYQLIQNQIRNRENLINTYNKEINQLTQNVNQLSGDISKGEAKLSRITSEYGKLLFRIHRAELVQNKWLLLLSSTSFNQAFVRWQYFRQVSSYRRNQKEEIEELQQQLADQRASLEKQKEETILRRKEKENQRADLAQELSVQDRILTSLKSDISKLRNEILRKEKQREALSNKIAALIAEKTKSLPASPAVTALSKDFEKNKGNLPWPTGKGILIRGYGQQNHPLLKNIKIVNDGIDIQTDPNATINSIFDGTVVEALYVPNNNMVVIINHGQYSSVYSNLNEVYVSKNQQIKMGDPIGVIGENQDGLPVLHFELWQKSRPQNPSQWIKNR